jgi:hypothetical protein
MSWYYLFLYVAMNNFYYLLNKGIITCGLVKQGKKQKTQIDINC